jgi:glycyl-tRNA synthetase (class II)
VRGDLRRDALGLGLRALGVELKENIKRQWWKAMVHAREDVVGLDSSIILPRQVWVASGHVGTFTDPLVECLSATSGSALTTFRRRMPPRRAGA